MNTSEGL